MVHGWGGTATSGWRPWLKSQLEKMGCEVLALDMPDTDTPVIEKWVGHLAEAVGTPDNDTFFVGHSIGCQTILRYLDSYPFEPLATVGGAVFVAGWFNLENLEDEESKAVARPWLERPIDLKKIKTVLPKSTLIISDNDPYGSFDNNKQKFAEIGSKIVVVKGAGHMTGKEGFREFPLLLSELEKFI
jgi:predicted alpha/beta hydrolase family esterase